MLDPLVAPVAVGGRLALVLVLVTVTVLLGCKELETEGSRPSTTYTRTEFIVK